jgi:hypothetical protein
MPPKQASNGSENGLQRAFPPCASPWTVRFEYEAGPLWYGMPGRAKQRDQYSNGPMSYPAPLGRALPSWSSGTSVGSAAPASMAGEPGCRW